MITIDQLKEAFGDKRKAFKNKNIDHDVTVISLLRNKIPYNEKHNIITAAEHDKIYLTDVDITLKYINEKDLEILADCNCCYDSEYESLYLFV